MKERKDGSKSIAVLKSAFSLLSRTDQKKMALVACLQLLMSILDLIGIFLIGLVASISLYGIQSKEPPEIINSILEWLSVENIDFQNQVALLGGAAGIILIGKTLLSAYFSRRILFFLNIKTAQITTKLMDHTFDLPYDQIKNKSTANLLFSLTRGVESLLAGVIGSASLIFTEASLLFVVIVGMLFFDPLITVFSILYFGLIGLIQGKKLNSSAKSNQEKSSKALVDSETQILNSFNMYRELHVRNARKGQVEKLGRIRIEVANLQSRVLFMPYVAKYSIEISLVAGAIILTGSQLILKDALSALTTLSIFLVAATRVSPSILRLQQGLIIFSAKSGESEKTLSLIKDIGEAERKTKESVAQFSYENFKGEIELSNVAFRYFDGTETVIHDFSLRVPSGCLYALVGPSGNGKTTIMDLMMGVIHPISGTVTIDGIEPRDFIERFPNSVGYVPQESTFISGSLRENLLLGMDDQEMSEEEINVALTRVGMENFIPVGRTSSEIKIGNRGASLSVGQRQRLSVARALVARPKLLFLDEPTSSLDSESELRISQLINSLRGETTIVVIAHRLETIRNADKVVWIEGGHIKKSGNYDEVFS